MSLTMGFISALLNTYRSSISGDEEEEMAFIYDGATFTPGTFTADSGERELTVELTLGGNSIASGIAYTWLGVSQYADFGTLPFTDANAQIYGIDSLAQLTKYSQSDTHYAGSFIVPASGGKMEFTVTLGNDGAVAVNHYAFILLPNGGVVVSDAISCPGYVAP